MGKRTKTKHPRIPRDLYQTVDPRAVPPLLPHLPKNPRYVEPFAGAGALVAQLAGHAECVLASDIVPLAEGIAQADAFSVIVPPGAIVITNCPWTRPILHRTIIHFSDQCRTFLLFDAGWAFTAQAAPYLDRCRKIIVVGRLKWIPGSKFQAMDDAAWYEFGQPVPGSRPVFYGRGIGPHDLPRRTIRMCFDCGNQIGARARWRLAERQGIVTTVHLRCTEPTAAFGAPEPAPLLDFIERSS